MWKQTPGGNHADSLPKRETLCLTKAANLQKILRWEEKGRKAGTGREDGEGWIGQVKCFRYTESKKKDKRYYKTGKRWRDVANWEDRHCPEGKSRRSTVHIGENSSIKKLHPQTWRSSPSLYWTNVLHCPELWQEWTGSTDNGSWSTDWPEAGESRKDHAGLNINLVSQ